MKIIHKTYKIKAPIEKVWQALIDPKIIDDWGGGPAKMDDKAGTHFTLWGGDIYGKNTEVIENKKLAQDWYSKKDQTGPTKVVFSLKSDGSSTELTLNQNQVSDQAYSDLSSGWDDYYCGAIKKLLEK